MKAVLDTNDRQFLARLHRLGPGTVQVICDDLGVTATAVRQRLTRLTALEMVTRELVRAGRGRPYYEYSVTDTGIRELGDNYADLALILWRELRNIEEPAVREQVAGRVRDALVTRYGKYVRSQSINDRLGELETALSENGFDVETDTSDLLPILRENSCPYHDLAQVDSGICELELLVFEDVLGTKVTRTQCCLEGDHCCEFQAAQR